MNGAAEPWALRRTALAVCVLDDVDLTVDDHGVTLCGRSPVTVAWAECRRAVAGAPPDQPVARQRLASWLTARRWLADRPPAELAEHLRPYGSPVTAENHPGLDWVRVRVLGDALDLGPAFTGLHPADPEQLSVLPAALLDAAGVDVTPWWPAAMGYLERMGRLAGDRHRRAPDTPLRPMGGCDVVTLLGSANLRRALVATTGGLRPLAVPMRTRGWSDLARIDSAFARAAAALTDPAERGFDRPVLVTRDEVVQALDGGRPAEIVLRDPATISRRLRPVPFN